MAQTSHIMSLKEAVRPATFIQSAKLNKQIGLDLTLCSETFQVTGSFKFRAAYNVASSVKQTHLIAASSGNFGQALAYACALLGKRCTIVMPITSAQIKVKAVRDFGAAVELVDTNVKSRAQAIKELSAQFPEAYMASPYDDPLVIAGNSTLGEELAAVCPAFDAVIVPVGGGGLSAGIIKGLAEHGKKSIQVFGAEPLIANDCARSLRAGHIESNAVEPQTIADGVRTLSIGDNNWAYLKDGLADVLEVSEEAIAEATRQLFFLANLKCEPTSALPLAAASAHASRFANKRVCCVVSGANVDAELFHKIICAGVSTDSLRL